MMQIDTSKPVMISGATGYLGGWIVRRLLEEGLTVHAAVRDPGNKAKVAHLTDIEADTPGTLKFFAADLLEWGSYKDAMEGCGIVIHAASPFTNTFDDPEKELIEPAVQGTRNVLEQANRTESVQRVVLTSSCAAIYGDTADCANAPGGKLTEELWNTTSTLENGAYALSKKLAEEEAWSIANDQDRWRLVVINPSFILGPGIKVDMNSESMSVFKRFGDGSFKSGAPKWGIGLVDVRDVAEAHLRAAFIPQANGRHIISGHSTNFAEMAARLREKYGNEYPVPRRTMPKALVWLLGPFVDKRLTRKAVSRNVGHIWRADTSKSVEKLGLSYRPMKETLHEMFQQLIDRGEVRPS